MATNHLPDKPKLLLATNGIAALKAIRSLRKWSFSFFGNPHYIHFIAMATPEDLDANAEFLRIANQIVEVPGGANHANFANVPLIVDLAVRLDADAVWAGWGHASENPALPSSLASVKNSLGNPIQFIGPSAGAMNALGDKISATLIAQTANVPCIPWNGSNIKLNIESITQDGVITIPDDIFQKSSLKTLEEAMEAAERVGFPLMLKASEAGGGKGIRKVDSMDEIESSYRQVQGEAPGSPIFAMKLAKNCRHIEVQIMADKYGNAISLSGRDCTVQRRHQKMLEEGPPIIVPDEIFKEMCLAAMRLSRAVNYSNAGTVEYLYDPAKREAYFLEMNPRLQVEHPVTELLTHTNIPSIQFQVAMGTPLYDIPDIRAFYGLNPKERGPFPFDMHDISRQNKPDGHVIASRIIAENPENGFKPMSGKVKSITTSFSDSNFCYFSINPGAGGKIHQYADSQFGHIFVHGSNREHARTKAILALSEITISGDIMTPIEYLQDLMGTKDYSTNDFHTTWLDQRIASQIKALPSLPKPHSITSVLCGAATTAIKSFNEILEEYSTFLHRGQIPNKILFSKMRSHLELISNDIQYDIFVRFIAPQCLSLSLQSVNNGESDSSDNTAKTKTTFPPVICKYHSTLDGGLILQFLQSGTSHIVHSQETATGMRLTVDGTTVIFTNSYDPSRIIAPMPGKLVSFLVKDGTHVKKGEPFAEIEVMKMYMPLSAPESGVISLRLAEGTVINEGDLIATLELDNPNQVKKAQLFAGKLPSMYLTPKNKPILEVLASSKLPHHTFRAAVEILDGIFSGYIPPTELVDECVNGILSCLSTRLLAVEKFYKMASESKFDLDTKSALLTTLLVARQQSLNNPKDDDEVDSVSDSTASEPIDENTITATTQESNPKPKLKGEPSETYISRLVKKLKKITEGHPPIHEWDHLLSNFVHGMKGFRFKILLHYMNKFFVEEQYFDSSEKRRGDVVLDLRSRFDILTVFQIDAGHYRLSYKTSVLTRILKSLVPNETFDPNQRFTVDFTKLLQKMVQLNRSSYLPIISASRQLLVFSHLPSFEERKIGLSKYLEEIISTRSQSPKAAARLISKLSFGSPMMIDLLFEFIYGSNPELAQIALEVYIMRVYRAYRVEDVQVFSGDKHTCLLSCRWTFFTPSGFSQNPMSPTVDNLDNLDASMLNTAINPPQSPNSHTIGQLGQNKFAPNGQIAPNLSAIRASDSTMNLFELEQVAARAHSEQSFPDRFGASSSYDPSRYGSAFIFRDLNQMFRQFYSCVEMFSSSIPLAPHERQQVSLTSPASSPRAYSGSATKYLNQNLTPSDSQNQEDTNINLATIHHLNVLSIAFLNPDNYDEQNIVDHVGSFIRIPENKAMLNASKIRRVTLAIYQPSKFPRYFTFHVRHSFAEEIRYRHIEPSLAFELELFKLSNYEIERIPTQRAIHLYFATEKSPKSKSSDHRFFVQTVVREKLLFDGPARKQPGFHFGSGESFFVAALDALEIASENPRFKGKTDSNHVFLNFIPPVEIGIKKICNEIQRMTYFHARRLVKLRINQAEIKVTVIESKGSKPKNMRFVAYNPSGFVLNVDAYREVSDPQTGAITLKHVFGIQNDPKTAAKLDGYDAMEPYKISDRVQRKRFLAQTHDSTYCYDFLQLFSQSVQQMWESSLPQRPIPSAGHTGFSDPWLASLATDPSVHLTFEEASRFFDLSSQGLNKSVVFQSEELILNPVGPSGSGTGSGTGSIEIQTMHNVSRTGSIGSIGSLTSVNSENSGSNPTGQVPSALKTGLETVTSIPATVVNTAVNIGASYASGLKKYFGFPKSSLDNTVAHTGSNNGIGQDIPPGSANPNKPHNMNLLNQSLLPSLSTGTTTNPKSPNYVKSSAEELASRLRKINRPPGQNDHGMIAFLIHMYTPEYPFEAGGRKIVLIINDITFKAGSFALEEDDLYAAASAYARLRGYPRVYVAANSGARIGLANEVRECFKVKWVHEHDPSKGFEYIYLENIDYQRLKSSGSILATPIYEKRTPFESKPSGIQDIGDQTSTRHGDSQSQKPGDSSSDADEDTLKWKITTIIGKENGIGVENLSGSGLIAGETARAYDKSVTWSIVSARTVGIGAYLVRLGQRIIQNEGPPILLTGAGALNKLLGREVYSSNNQLGGIQIMHTNGVSHLVSPNDARSASLVLDMLRYVPNSRIFSLLPTIHPRNPFVLDSWDRDVTFHPPHGAYDVRHLLTGHNGLSGLFDRGSWVETLAGWAKTVVCGRARLSGYPVGVICVENRSVEKRIPADPANNKSNELVVQQAGQVWYPDSAAKTAQAIRDFNREDLPLFILASWRGFSGGMRDMFEEILKFGSEIVDGLKEYSHPIFVYLPPRSELRGGAWVVLDSQINPYRMEMYAAHHSRGGILEPSGTVSIKYRTPAKKATMQRLDTIFSQLKTQTLQVGLTDEKLQELKIHMDGRYDFLSPSYDAVAHHFADLHDTPKRMFTKGVIRQVVDWKDSRRYFTLRLERLLHQDDLAKLICLLSKCVGVGDGSSGTESSTGAGSAFAPEEVFKATQIIRGWFLRSHLSSRAEAENIWINDDEAVLKWLSLDRSHWSCLFVLRNGQLKTMNPTVSDHCLENSLLIPCNLITLYHSKLADTASRVFQMDPTSLVHTLLRVRDLDSIIPENLKSLLISKLAATK